MPSDFSDALEDSIIRKLILGNVLSCVTKEEDLEDIVKMYIINVHKLLTFAYIFVIYARNMSLSVAYFACLTAFVYAPNLMLRAMAGVKPRNN